MITYNMQGIPTAAAVANFNFFSCETRTFLQEASLSRSCNTGYQDFGNVELLSQGLGKRYSSMSSSLLFQLFETGIQQSEWVIVSHNNSIATISKHKDLRSRLTELLHLFRGARTDAWQLGLSF